ncbi:MAG TPA: putative zinc-binding protein [bacterium]|nr:putative zinc-binding protein [bacterium]
MAKARKQEVVLRFPATRARCPVGETTGRRCATEGRIPVISCEGACVRGEIARQAANEVARHAPYARGCHGEFFTVPGSAMAAWMRAARRVVVIDGCFLRCHARVLKKLLGNGKVVAIDALPLYGKFTEVFAADAVPAATVRRTAQQVARRVLTRLRHGRGGAAGTTGRKHDGA